MVIEARVQQKTDTLANWNANPLVLLSGEPAFIVSENGAPLNFRIGDGTKPFAQLPNWIAYDQAAYKAIIGNVLPASDGQIHYSIVGAGTYTQSSGGSLVVDDNQLGIISDNGTQWSIDNVIDLPKGEDGKTIETYDSTKVYNEGSQVIENNVIYQVKVGQSLAIGEKPIDNPTKVDVILKGGVDFIDNVLPFEKTKAINSSSLYKYLKNISNNNKGIEFTYKLNDFYTSASDPKLSIGYIQLDGLINPDANSRIADISIPEEATVLRKINFTTNVYFSFTDANNVVISTQLSNSENITIPSGAKKIRITVVGNWGSQDWDTTSFVYFNQVLGQGSNPYVQISDLSKPLISSTEILKLDKYILPNDSSLLPGYIDNSGSYISGGTVYKTGFFSIPSNVYAIEKFNLFGLTGNIYYQFTNANLVKLGYGKTTDTNITIPDGASRIYITIVENSGANYLNTSTSNISFLGKGLYLITNENLLKSYNELTNLGMISLAKKQYTFVGDDFRIYQENMYSGFKPRDNYNIEFSGDAVIKSRNDKGRFVIIDSAGQLNVSVYDLNRQLITDKTTTVFIKPKPTNINYAPNSSKKMQVLFIGDSLIHFNQNRIGAEWLRMMNTNEPQSIVDNVVYKQAFNLGGGNIDLVGKSGNALNKYENANELSLIMTNTTSSNPFYNPDSTQPNELDAEGFNKRVDFAWYFQQIAGVGKYPKYIYFACGVNDIVSLGWDITKLDIVKERMRLVLGRMKKACDAIAGGNSDVKILLVNHQFYPLNEGKSFNSTFSAGRQRILWAKHYENYENLIDTGVYDNKPLNAYVRFVDCASSFDIDYGYTYNKMTVNPRNTFEQNVVDDMVHIGESGSLMYADGLLRDFLYNECS